MGRNGSATGFIIKFDVKIIRASTDIIHQSNDRAAWRGQCDFQIAPVGVIEQDTDIDVTHNIAGADGEGPVDRCRAGIVRDRDGADIGIYIHGLGLCLSRRKECNRAQAKQTPHKCADL